MSIAAMRQALEYVQEFKRRWWAVPPFGNKVNKATREAVSAAHSPIFQIEDALRAAIEQAEKPVAFVQIAPQREWAWMPAPIKTQWGHDMVVADLAIDKDHTVSIYCERDQIKSVEAMFAPQPQQVEKPVAYLVEYSNGEKEVRFQPNGWGDKVTPLYTAPRQLVGLTDEEINAIYVQHHNQFGECISGDWGYERDLEAKLKDKNS